MISQKIKIFKKAKLMKNLIIINKQLKLVNLDLFLNKEKLRIISKKNNNKMKKINYF